MQHKLMTMWREGSVVVEGDKIAIRQGKNVVYVTSSQVDEFLTDIQDASFPKPTPGVGFGGTVSPIAPKKPKSMDDLVDNLLFTAKGWHNLKT
jgi:hypothetical protein